MSRVSAHAHALGVDLRPHAKTAKSAEVVRRATAGHSGAITVATLAEAEYFAANGFTDILYAVAFVPSKLPRVGALLDQGVDLAICVDTPAVAREVAERTRGFGTPLRVFLEIDGGSGRMGFAPDAPALLETVDALRAAPGLVLGGLFTFAGRTYTTHDLEARREWVMEEKAALVSAAETIRAQGADVPVVSLGATPAVLALEDARGVTELRPGVYTFMDLMQEELGVCGFDDLAVTVLTSVIGHRQAANRIYVDAGALALSQDRGLASTRHPGAPYGLVQAPGAHDPWEDLAVVNVNQEHGFIERTGGGAPPFDELAEGTRVRILPNHVCHTAFGFRGYYVVDEGDAVVDFWGREDGW